MEPTEQNQGIKRYVKISLALHVALFAACGIGALFKPRTLSLSPSVQIDMVALPDILKNAQPEAVDTTLPVKNEPVPPAPHPEPEEKTVAKPEPKARPEPKSAPAPDEMALERKKEKAAADRAKAALAQMRERLKKERQADEEKRREALEKRKEDLKHFEQTYRNALKGNQTNQGSSVSGEMGETVNAYAGHITDRIRSNWALPSFLQGKDLSARMVIYLDARGNVIRMEFTKVSGNSLFDNNVEAAVRRSSPFLPPPAEMASGLRNGGIEVKFPL